MSNIRRSIFLDRISKNKQNFYKYKSFLFDNGSSNSKDNEASIKELINDNHKLPI